jgi:hypothetical protein
MSGVEGVERKNYHECETGVRRASGSGRLTLFRKALQAN